MAGGVELWWWFLIASSAVNAVAWLQAARALRRREAAEDPCVRSLRRRLLGLAAVYLLGCAFRSFYPRADVQRISLVDSWLSNVTLGRSVATVAELCFALQWALLLRALGDAAQVRLTQVIATLLVPLIAFAETSSWYAVLTTNFLGNAIEQSTWTLCGALIAVGLLGVRSRLSPEARPFVHGALAVSLAFVAFMSSVDVPLYYHRWIAQQHAGVAYLGWSSGLRDATEHWIVTFSFARWRSEMLWMALYFSVGVWVSIALSFFPQLRGPEPRASS
jgi:hypothetical protein